MTRLRQRAGGFLVTLGIAILLVELIRYWLKGHAIHAWPVVIGSAIGFVGFYMLDPGGAKDGAGVIEDFTVRVLAVIRSGRRSTDTKVVVDVEDRPKLTDNDSGVG